MDFCSMEIIIEHGTYISNRRKRLNNIFCTHEPVWLQHFPVLHQTRGVSLRYYTRFRVPDYITTSYPKRILWTLFKWPNNDEAGRIFPHARETHWMSLCSQSSSWYSMLWTSMVRLQPFFLNLQDLGRVDNNFSNNFVMSFCRNFPFFESLQVEQTMVSSFDW